MLEIEERLLDEYKRVDNFCRDSYSSQDGVKQYIAEMEQIFSYGRSVISSWHKDYSMLNRVKKLRNKIAHETSATDCTEKDAEWLGEFSRRLLERRDPLALLRTAEQKRSNYLPQKERAHRADSEQWAVGNANLQDKKESSPNKLGSSLIVFVEILIIIVAVAAFFCYIANW